MEISDLKNYLPEIKSTSKEIIEKYKILIKEYIELFLQNVNFSDKIYLNNIFLRGLSTLNNVFNLLLLYTKNLDLTFVYSKKSIFFYIEFIDQISEDANSFLQLNSQDAILFVYKKTIYEIDNNYRKDLIFNNESDKNRLHIVKELSLLYKKIIIFYLNNSIDLNDISKYMSKTIRKTSCTNLKKENLKQKNNIISRLILKNISVDKFNAAVIHFLKNHKINENNVIAKLESSDFDNINNKYHTIKFVNWIIN